MPSWRGWTKDDDRRMRCHDMRRAYLLRCMSPFMAQSGLADRMDECLLLAKADIALNITDVCF